MRSLLAICVLGCSFAAASAAAPAVAEPPVLEHDGYRVTEQIGRISVSKGEKVLWQESGWSGYSLAELERENGEKTWTVKLTLSENKNRKYDVAKYLELATGKNVTPPEKPPAGALTKCRELSGVNCACSRGFVLFVSSKDNWNAVTKRMFGQADVLDPYDEHAAYSTGDHVDAAPPAPDFETQVAVVLCCGDSTEPFPRLEYTGGVFEDETRVLLRIDRGSFQMSSYEKKYTFGENARPWMVWYLPRVAGKSYCIEKNLMPYLDRLHDWEEILPVLKPTGAAAELDPLPPRPVVAAAPTGKIEHYQPDREALVPLDSAHLAQEYDYYTAADGSHVRHGAYRNFSSVDDEKVRSNYSGTYQRGLRQGLWTQWFVDQDAVEFTVTYRDGRLDGAVEAFYRNGKKKFTGQFAQGKRAGMWTYFAEDGSKQREQNYDK